MRLNALCVRTVRRAAMHQTHTVLFRNYKQMPANNFGAGAACMYAFCSKYTQVTQAEA